MATISIIRVENPEKKEEISAHILHALPDWFGLPDSTQKYIDDSRNLPEYHRSGIGRQLFAAIRAEAIARGYRLLQVKTVQTGHYAEYDRTNAFYQRMGFLPLECLPTLWDEWNPCQVYVLPLQNS